MDWCKTCRSATASQPHDRSTPQEIHLCGCCTEPGAGLERPTCDESNPLRQKCVKTGRTRDDCESLPFRFHCPHRTTHQQASRWRYETARGSTNRPVRLRRDRPPGDTCLLDRFSSTKTVFDVGLACDEGARQGPPRRPDRPGSSRLGAGRPRLRVRYRLSSTLPSLSAHVGLRPTRGQGLLAGIAASTLEFLAKLARTDTAGEGALANSCPRRRALPGSLGSWLPDLELVLAKTRRLGREVLSVYFLALFHLVLKILLLGAPGSSPDLDAELQIEGRGSPGPCRRRG
ncbi:hypothetical protein LX36DRAFT_258613 [Colletotrichum falcatum]|nr:hypothetical protein LX36DRAFT_258613 [Colletotrichum falcatum]